MAESTASKFAGKITSDGKIGQGGLAAGVGDTSWQAVKTSDFTAVADEGYFVDTTSTAVEVTLPASPSAGDYVILKDYARTWATNNVSIASALFDGVSRTQSFSTEGQTVTLVYMDGTKGWSLINEDTTTGLGAAYVTATGGTVTTSGDYKIHTFTGDGCFVVSDVGNPQGSTAVDYLVVAGGGGGGNGHGGGGAAGGMRLGAVSCIPAPISPYTAPGGISVSATTYPITVGAGGAGQPYPEGDSTNRGRVGSNSVFSTITSTGGGGGGSGLGDGGPGIYRPGQSGGSGGGAGTNSGTGGTGNTPPTSPSQGNNGGNGGGPGPFGVPFQSGGGGGGHAAAGLSAAPSPVKGGDGGNGSPITAIFGAAPQPFYDASGVYAGGGGGGTLSPTTAGSGGTGGGGNGSNSGTGTAGTANTGGGGGGGAGSQAGGSAGKGIVIIRYKFQN